MSTRQTKSQLAASLTTTEGQLRSRELLLERACQDRDTALQRLSSCAAENTAYRQQRDEAVTVLATLVAAQLDMSSLEVDEDAAGFGAAVRRAAALVERYRSYVVPPDAHETG